MQDYQYLENVVANIVLEDVEYKHQNLVRLITKTLAFKSYSDSDIKKVTLGTYVMDIGLHLGSNNVEYEYHPITGCIYVGTEPSFDIIKNVVLLHHENYIGTGFPYGLIGEEVPEYVQIVSICNQFIINRDKKMLSYDENIEYLKLYYNKELIGFLSMHVF
jgi:HD-GYP domain-containing protein (c-di-GMP phosphodiesterase class II)